MSFLYTRPVLRDFSKHEVEQYLDLLGLTDVDLSEEIPFFSYSQADIDFAESFLKANHHHDRKPLIGFHTGSHPSTLKKRWPIHHFAMLADMVSQKLGADIVIVGGTDDAIMANEIAGMMSSKPIIAAGKTTLKQTAAIIVQCALFVSADTGPMHIAAAVGTPLVALFGPTAQHKTRPYTTPGKYRIVSENLPCSPCHTPYSARIECEHASCMELITPHDVFQVIRGFLGSALAYAGRGAEYMGNGREK